MALHRKRRQLGAQKGEDVVWLDILEPVANLNPRYATWRKYGEVGAPLWTKLRTLMSLKSRYDLLCDTPPANRRHRVRPMNHYGCRFSQTAHIGLSAPGLGVFGT